MLKRRHRCQEQIDKLIKVNDFLGMQEAVENAQRSMGEEPSLPREANQKLAKAAKLLDKMEARPTTPRLRLPLPHSRSWLRGPSQRRRAP